MSYTRFLRWALLVGSALIFFVPFIIADGGAGYQNTAHANLYIPFAGMYFPFITGKNFMFRIVVELMLGAYVLLALREPKYRPRASMLSWAVLAFVGWMALATVLSVDPAKSFWSNFERMEGYMTILHFLVYFYIVGTVVTAENWWNRLFQISITSGALMGVYSMLQFANLFPISSQSGSRVDGTFGNATYLAVFMLWNVFLTLFMLFRQRQSTAAQVLYGIALVLEVATLYFTETRGSFLGLIGGLIVAALYIIWKARGQQWHSMRRASWIGLGIIAALVIGFVALRSTSLLQNAPSTIGRISSISLEDTTTKARLFYIWPMAIKGSFESPKTAIVGWGQENFNFVFNKYYSPEMYNQEQWFDRAHNQFLDWLIAGGLPAFLLYISFFLLAAWSIMRSSLAEPEQAILMGALAAYGFNNLFVFDDLMSSVYFFLILAFAHSLFAQKPPRFAGLARPVSDQGIAIAAPIVGVLAILLVWAANVPGMARAENILTALTPQVAVPNSDGTLVAQAKDGKTRLADFKTAFGNNTWPGTDMGRQEVAEQFLQYASTIAASTSVDPSVKQDTLVAAQNAVDAVMQQRKNDARLELFDGAFLDSFGQYPQALEILAQAHSHSPQKQQVLFEIGVTYLNAGQKDQAIPILKQAFDMEPAYSDARILYAAGLYYAGQGSAADALLKDGFGTVLVNDARLLQVYVNTKQYDRVVGIWKLRVEAAPNDAQAHLGLAAAYFTASDKTNAIAELNRAAQLNPSLASQIQSVITQIQNGTLKP
ncbi:MAG TPA: O-antigen ligase family protein [Candidatus Paceibacterota bacterium]|nr:O-antigen ligase family protein [Candidatus Paceibacterota bacterium]